MKDATAGAKMIFNIVSAASMAKWRVKVRENNRIKESYSRPLSGCPTVMC